MLSTFSRRPAAAFKSRVVALGLWSMEPVRKAMSRCTCMSRRSISMCYTFNYNTNLYSGPDPKDVQHAKELCEDLLTNVKEQYQRHKDNPPQRAYSGGHGDRQQQTGAYSGYGAGYGAGYGGYGGYGQGAAGATVQSPTAAPGTAPGASTSGADYSSQWAQYFAQNPQAYAYYYSQQQQQVGAAGQSSDPPPPPPPISSPGGGYNSVSILDILYHRKLMEF